MRYRRYQLQSWFGESSSTKFIGKARIKILIGTQHRYSVIAPWLYKISIKLIQRCLDYQRTCLTSQNAQGKIYSQNPEKTIIHQQGRIRARGRASSWRGGNVTVGSWHFGTGAQAVDIHSDIHQCLRRFSNSPTQLFNDCSVTHLRGCSMIVQ